MVDEQKLVDLVTRGLASIQEQLREREGRITLLSEKMVGFEFKLDQLNKTVSKVETDMSKAETERIKMRLDQIEELLKEAKTKANDNAKWIKGLLGSVVLLLIGFLFNFIRISIK